jgi:hypothetical protein
MVENLTKVENLTGFSKNFKKYFQQTFSKNIPKKNFLEKFFLEY